MLSADNSLILKDQDLIHTVTNVEVVVIVVISGIIYSIWVFLQVCSYLVISDIRVLKQSVSSFVLAFCIHFFKICILDRCRRVNTAAN